VITQLRIGNARVFEGDEWSFPISSLTILCGANSAGKSTVLRCLLLLRQAILSREGSLTQESRSKLRFSGGLIELGNFRSFISHNALDQDLHLGLSISAAMDATGLLPSRDQLSPVEPQADEPEPNEQYIPYELHADFRFGMQSNDSEKVLPALEAQSKSPLEIEETRPNESHAILKGAKYSITHNDRTILEFELLIETTSLPSGVGYFLRLPRAYVKALPELESLYFD